MSDQTAKPTVLFVCAHNAGRSQMAAGWLAHLAGGKVRVVSAGSAPKGSINPVAVEVMAEAGIDISGGIPRRLEYETAQEADVIVTMGTTPRRHREPVRQSRSLHTNWLALTRVEMFRYLPCYVRERAFQEVRMI